eukprot:SAG25_NODE_4793_length_748_cov_0.953775_1_plen_53_part_01
MRRAVTCMRVNAGLGKYVPKFEEQDIRGDVLLDLTNEECESVLDIKVLGHRKL